jgi:methylenetetrahydrofolate--tRNA-(uracil-5-)-methyltransferase
METIKVIGGGLAGSEASWQAAEAGAHVQLYEMRPEVQTGAHQTSNLGELVCSNSLGSKLPDRASGVLLRELEQLGSILVQIAQDTSVPAGGALAVDRELFSERVTEALESHSRIEVIREEVLSIPPGPVILASGPLTSDALAEDLSRMTGQDHLYFFDALSPIVELDSLDMDIAFRGSRYGRGELESGDYINCPMDEIEYNNFIEALLAAQRIPLRSFEDVVQRGVKAGMSKYFEGCLPIEVIAERGHDALAFGPMRPVGLIDPRTNQRSHAVVQLRQDNLVGSIYNLVGFQTNLTYKEQRRVLRLIPGMAQANFVRYGQMHRNTFVNAPELLRPTLQFRGREDLLLAGQITGVEGYLGNIATGWLAGANLPRILEGRSPLQFPKTTMLGALCHYISHAEPKEFQPMKANFGILPKLTDGVRRNRRERAGAYAARAAEDIGEFTKHAM